MVDEFLDVFLEELLGLPPDREIKYYVNLVPRARPISIPPYRMVPAKLTELRKQIEELLEKGFIWSSTSHRGAPILFAKKAAESLKIYVDYQKLNQMMVKNKYAPPSIDNLF